MSAADKAWTHLCDEE